jgi:hypothetical protein
LVDEFYPFNLLPSGIKSYFFTLVPEIKRANNLKDFRPTSLVESLYKIILKLLAIRVKHIMSEVFNDYQNAFIKEKQISDNVLITNKAINIIKKREGK